MTNADIKDIIELANIIAERQCDSEDCAPCIRMGRRCNDYLKAERAIKAGYRKQREALYCADPNYRTLGNCGECGGDVTCLDNYCPNCGAKMKGGE